MSDEEISDHEFDTFEDDTFKDDEDELEDLEEPINRNKGNWIYNDMSEKELGKLIDENSILLRVPSDGLILKSPPLSKAN
jgi:hypothetical protein